MLPVALLAWTLADVRSFEIGPLRVEVQTPNIVALNESIAVNITIQGPQDVRVVPPKLDGGMLLGSGILLGFRVDGPDLIDGKYGKISIQNWRMEIEPTKLGKIRFPKLESHYLSPGQEKKALDIEIPELAVVQGSGTGTSKSAIPHPPPELAGETASQQTGTILKTLGIAGLITVLIMLAFNSRKRRDAVGEARTALEMIDPQMSNPRLGINSACDVVRDYLVQRYRLPASTKPTPEFLADELVRNTLPGDRFASLQDFLQAADCARFPEPVPTNDDLAACLNRARGFLAGEST